MPPPPCFLSAMFVGARVCRWWLSLCHNTRPTNVGNKCKKPLWTDEHFISLVSKTFSIKTKECFMFAIFVAKSWVCGGFFSIQSFAPIRIGCIFIPILKSLNRAKTNFCLWIIFVLSCFLSRSMFCIDLGKNVLSHNYLQKRVAF